MKKKSFKIACCLLLFTGFLLNYSCKKDVTQNPNGDIVIDTTIYNNQVLKYDLGSFGIEEGATITRQATHFSQSSLERNGMGIIYTYKPLNDFSGKDTVVIKSERGSDGAHPGNKINFTTIRVNVLRR